MLAKKRDFLKELEDIDEEIRKYSIEELKHTEEQLSKEDSEELEINSVEQNKKLIIENIHRISLLSKTGRLDSIQKQAIRTDIMKILSLNRRVIEIIKVEGEKAAISERLGRQQVSIDEKKLLDEQNAQKLMQDVKTEIEELLKKDDIKWRFEGEIRDFGEIEAKLKDIKEIDAQKIKNIALIRNEFSNLRKTIYAQNNQCHKILGIINETLIFKIEKLAERAPDLVNEILKLADMINKELTEHNKILRTLYNRAMLQQKEGEFKQIEWLEKRSLQLDDELLLMLNQFRIPRVEFPSGNYVTITCSKANAMKVITDRFIEEHIYLSPFRKIIRLGADDYEISCTKYVVNALGDSDDTLVFILPEEEVLGKAFISAKSLESGELFKIGKPIDTESILQNAKKIIQYFDDVLKECDGKFNEWIEEAKKLNKNFKENWDKDARAIITNDFAKRWIRDLSSYDKNREVYEILRFYYDEEELMRMNKEEFMKAIRQAKQKYMQHVQDCELFLKENDPRQAISNAILIAPKAEALFWESFFRKNDTRPNTYYYDGSLKSGVKEGLKECMIIGGKKLPKLKEIEIYEMPEKKKIFMT